VFAEHEAQLLISEAATPAKLDAMVAQRVAGRRLEHILGWAEFYGRRIPVDPGVFVPRRCSGLLVQEAIALAGPGVVVIDLCCGSGALGLVMATELPNIELYAADIDPAAVRCARRNLAARGGRVYQGDLLNALPVRLRGRVDILIANVPYVPTGALDFLPREARIEEPRVALDGGADGLKLLRRVAAEAFVWLAPGGHVLVETSVQQARQASKIFSDNGLHPRVSSSEELNATVISGGRANR
jgi:release factor glutamine methyltransferase